MDRGYVGNQTKDIKPTADIEEPIIPLREIGQTVAEGRQFGTFLQSSQAAIRAGVGQIELQPGMGGGEEPTGAENYGKDSREALRELARVNAVKFTSIHTPVQIGNMSGFNPQQREFSDEYRDKEVEEVKSAIKFAAEVSQGGAVVVHTGEYQRPMFDAFWNKEGKWKNSFRQYVEESKRAVKPLVDVRTGKLIQEVRMNQIVPRAVWNRYESGNEFYQENSGSEYHDEEGVLVKEGDYIDYEGRRLERPDRIPKYDKEKNTVVIREERWDDLVKEAEDINKIRAEEENMSYADFIISGKNNVVTPEEAFLYATTETQEAVSKGWAGNYSERSTIHFKELEKYKKALKFYEKLESNISEEDKWKLKQSNRGLQLESLGLVPREYQMPTDILREEIEKARESISSIKEMVKGQLQQAKDQEILRRHAVSASKYATTQFTKSYAEAGIEAMQQTDNNPYTKRDIFLAPENIWPEMGYGSHPEELLQLVKKSRKKMVEYLIEQQVEDPAGSVDPETGKAILINNPHFTGMSRKEAEKEAEQHIKATLDTQHLGMWFNSFAALPGETRQKRKKRFNKWYLDEVEKLAEENIIGNVHLVDAMGGSHQHLPAGQGDLPLKDTLRILKKHGFKGSINSEGHGEERFGAGRILLETWKEFGTPIQNLGSYGSPGMPNQNWGRVQHGYFGQTYPPYFIFGAYSPSNDWQLWSEVPME